MFERNRIDNAPEPSAVPAEVTLVGGTLSKGKLLVPRGKTLADVLNGGAFVEFEPYKGQRTFIATAQIVAVKPVGVPKAPSLARHGRDQDDFDPHAVLGIGRDASWADVRSAYHRLAMAYHPDRYASAELPAEVVEYLYLMAQRVNAAYAALEAPHQVAKTAAAARATAVYASAGAP
jgi:hypothetical protein